MLGWVTPISAADTWVFTVQVTATVSEAPPQIRLNWLPDPYGAESYAVFRKSKAAQTWGSALAFLPGSATAFADTNVQIGSAYEYQVVKNATLGYTGYGYIYAGIRVPLTEDRGALALVVETNVARELPEELAQLEQDLAGDGWEVRRIGISAGDSPESVRERVLAEYNAAPDRLNTVFLLGHVPIAWSGNLNYDTHGPRPMPADGYYGYTGSNWSLVADRSPDYFPGDITLKVGRVDFFNMPGVGARVPWPSETELLKNYLRKDHLWRQAQLPAGHRALMGNSRGDQDGESVATSGYRAFHPSVGPENIVEANVEYGAPPEERWIAYLARDSYLWAYGCGGGGPDACGGLGTNVIGENQGLLLSRDVVEQDAKAAFVLLFGSWFADWTLTDNLMRSFLATRTLGLAAASAGRPQWYMHHLTLGETLGYSARVSMNNEKLYLNQSNGLPRAVFQSLMGDPTLRLEPVPPPTQLNATYSNGSVILHWEASRAPVEGYHIYRSARPAGPFERVTSSWIQGTSFVDFSPGKAKVYMVRAVALQQNPSGSYYNPSQGSFATLLSPAQVIRVSAKMAASGVSLSWNSEPGATYRVQVLEDGVWRDASGTVSNAEWTDPETTQRAHRFYRVASP